MTSRLQRQSFLGPRSDEALASATVGIVGLGGGGSHLVQQLAHLGVGGYVLVDPQRVDKTNTNRLVGATLKDAEDEVLKVEIATRIIKGLEPSARIVPVSDDWINAMLALRQCDIILGAVDSLQTRSELERFSRANLIPYIDVGMTVTAKKTGGFLISGQVIRSIPGQPCLWCSGFITEYKLKLEAEKYGDAGANPQVVWSNGVLASSAVGLCVGMITPWSKSPPFVYLVYDGNEGTLKRSDVVEAVQDTVCPHYPAAEVGEPRFRLSEATT